MFFRLACLVLFPALITSIPESEILHQNGEVSARIVGGVPADIKDFPFQVYVSITNENDFHGHTCGGVIVSQFFIISAAHCVDNRNITIRVNSSLGQEGGSVYAVKKKFVHPKYMLYEDSIDYDLAILELEKPLIFGSGVQPIRLPQPEERLPNRTVLTISGWGKTIENKFAQESPVLLTVNVLSYTNEECAVSYAPAVITDRMICGGVPGGGYSSCQGDSGGPVTHGGVVYGLVSWGKGCARAEYPDLFTRLAHWSIRTYIKEITGR